MRIVLLGAPGSGKGTQATVLAEHYGVRHIGVGDILRQTVAENSGAGEELRQQMTAGDLVDDDVVLRVVWPKLVEAAADGGYILDGFPRTLNQARMATRAARSYGGEADVVVYLKADCGVLLQRILERDGERSDDEASVVLHRLQVFEQRTLPLVEFYAARRLLVNIDASRAASAVSRAILAAVETRVGRPTTRPSTFGPGRLLSQGARLS